MASHQQSEAGGFHYQDASEYAGQIVRPASQQTSESERSLLNGSYSNLDDTSVEGSTPPSPLKVESSTSAAPTFKLPPLPAPDSSFLSDEPIPFRARSSYKYATWARTFHSRPELFIQPHSTEEVQKIVLLARQRRRRITTVGSGHSPSNLTCTSSWMLNLDDLSGVLDVRKYHTNPAAPQPRYAGRALVQAGISLQSLNLAMKSHGLTLPNLGSIHVQSLAGAIATATHGSSLHHGILSSNIRGLRIVLPDGTARWCSAAEHSDLFRAALVSLGALGIITELEIELAPSSNVSWQTSTLPISSALSSWNSNLWTQDEFVRCWWMPYTRRFVVWSGSKTSQPCRAPDRSSSYSGLLGYHLYQSLLWIANLFPSLVPSIERIVMGMEHGFSTGRSNSGVDEQRTALLMDCLYSQFVNEWAIPLHKGPEAIRRFESWLIGPPGETESGIPFSNKGLYAHSPVEVRVGNGTVDEGVLGQPRAFLDQSIEDGPTLYLNATLYRPYGQAPPWTERYYEAFEWLMREMGGRPHWAKNFGHVTSDDFEGMYGDGMRKWKQVRESVDPDGLFIGEWHRRCLLGDGKELELEEREVSQTRRWGGGIQWAGEQVDVGKASDFLKLQ